MGQKRFWFLFLFTLVLGTPLLAKTHREIIRTKFSAPGKYLIVELLDDDLAHFEFSAKLPGPLSTTALSTSPMIAQTSFPGPSRVQRVRKRLETPAMAIQVDESSLCVTVKDKIKNVALTQICPSQLDQYWKGFTLSRESIQNWYGLGQEFHDPGVIDGDWSGRVRHYGGTHGNKMVAFNGGANGNTQIPILYGLGEGMLNYALFLDSVYQQQWDFSADPAQVQMYGDQIRFYVMTGPSLDNLRKKYMGLVGHPLVPPKKMFGLWVSEYGYRSWDHVERILATLRNQKFPIDGFLLDLFWYGGIKQASDDSPMGKLTWDPVNFASPTERLAAFRDKDGIGIIPIEESYVAKNLTEHQVLEQNGYLVKDRGGKAAYLTQSSWWGQGGMIDWSNEAAGKFWHTYRREALIQAGVAGHWVDLGEPEISPTDGIYAGGNEPDVHNMYNFKWLESIFNGYAEFHSDKRPFSLSRSGAAGIQRFGAAMWSGDIGSDLSSLSCHQNAQMHMSLSGIDYYGSDVGGFHREALQGDLNEMYTQWFAYSMLFDVPGRPHTENLCLCKETSPDRIGDLASNLQNIRLRYQLIPYVYSLAHEAYLSGAPVFPPPLYYFQADKNLRQMAHEKMVGPFLLAGVVSKFGQRSTDVYLPEGKWFNFRTEESLESSGATVKDISLYPDGKFTLPLYAKAGGIIPLMQVDDKTMNSMGKRSDHSTVEDFRLRIYLDASPSSFAVYEDDGESTAYQSGGVQKTLVSQSGTTVQISGTKAYPGGVEERNNILELVVDRADATQIILNESPLLQRSSQAEWDSSEAGWLLSPPHRILIKTGTMLVSEDKTINLKK